MMERACVCVCVYMCACMYKCVCERERGRDGLFALQQILCFCSVCVCVSELSVCVREGSVCVCVGKRKRARERACES